MGLSFRAIPKGKGILKYIPAGNCCATLVVAYSDGTLYHLDDESYQEIPNQTTAFSFKSVPSPIVIDGDKFFENVSGELDVQYNAEYEQLNSEFRDLGWDNKETRYWLTEYPSNRIPCREAGHYERRSGLYLYTVDVDSKSYIRRTYQGTRLIYEQSETYKRIDDEHGLVSGHYINGSNPYSYQTTIRTVGTAGYAEIPSWNSLLLQRQIGSIMVGLQSQAKDLVNLVPKSAEWDAALDAARGTKAYDLNMVEALLNFGIEDLIPKSFSVKSVNALYEAINSRNPITWMCRLLQISGCMYLYDTYVVSNNVRDIAQITGLDPDVAATVSKAAKTLSEDGCKPQEINQQLYTVARRISFDERYFSSTYGASTTSVHEPDGIVYSKVIARLRATPGEYADISTLGILIDEFGLKFTATRGVEAIPWEFAANWFLPIEKTVESIEYNNAHLDALYNVRSLTTSFSLKKSVNEHWQQMVGLSHAHVTGQIRYYKRTVSDHFPETVFDFSNGHGGISGKHLLQGSALMISK